MSLHGVTIDSFQERFWSKVNKTDDCWLWSGSLSDGYGLFGLGKKVRKAHRVSLEMTLGRELTSGLLACHSCRNRHCVNPAHLREDTHSANTNDSINDGTFCKTNGYKKGTHHNNAKISEDQVRAIRADTRTTRDIGKAYGISHQTVSDIKTGKRWSWLK